MVKFQNLAELFEFGVKTYRNPKLLNYKSQGVWKSISADEAFNRVKNIALGLYSLGIRFGDKIALLSESRPEWTLTDLGIISIGAIDVPIYTTQSLPQVEFIITNSESKLIFISTKQLYERILPVLEKLGFTDKVITFEKEPPAPGVMTLEQLESIGEKLNNENPSLYDELKSKVKPDDLATIIYTSGTTGEPKGVMLTHSNLISNATTCASLFSWNADKEVALTYLPLSHIFERMIIYLYLYIGIQIWYAESIDKLADNLIEVKPTVMTTVPRFLEKAEERMLAQVQKMSSLKRKLFNWAMDIARQFDPEKKFPLSYRIKHKIADILVYKKLRERFGGRFRFIVSGGAALRPDLARIFTAAGIPVLQGYGLTETSPVISVNRLERNRIGSVGPVIPGVAVKIAEDGEIWVDGPNVMKGYYKNEEATQRAFYCTWFKTGDIGYIDKDGFLFITDRKKDLIKTSGGKFIAKIDVDRRKSVMKNHSATHLLHSALRKVLGTHVQQAGSLVAPDRLRFDFTHPKKLSKEEIEMVEHLVNDVIFEDIELVKEYKPLKQALEEGALAFFGDKYGDIVRTVRIGDFSYELCGGTHLDRTIETGYFKIIYEGSIASGVRRVEAITGKALEKYIKEKEEEIQRLNEKIDTIIEEKQNLEKELERIRLKIVADEIDKAVNSKDVLRIDGFKVVSLKVEARNIEEMKRFGDILRSKIGSGVGLLASVIDDKINFVCVVTDDLVKERKLDAGKIVRDVAKITG
ncbi:long-chain acyl-CoA synthetase, partial [Candidatus Kryptobacter tengchongensis]